MRRLVLWLMILGSLTSTLRADELPKLPAKAQFHLYLLIGQSNMAGRGAIEEQDKQPPPRVLKFAQEKTWAPAVDPLHFDKPIAGVGLGTTFGRVMAEAHPDVVVGLIPCAVGGTPLARWQKGGDLYKQAVERTQVALKDGTLKGILWHQGEADSGSEKTATTYAERLAQMIRDLRTELNAGDVPFVAGELGQFLNRESKDGKPSYWPLVNEQINSLPKLVPHTAVASSKDLKHKGDVVHFDSPSLREFGKRYATAMQGLHAATSQKTTDNASRDLKPIKIAMIGDSTMATYPKPPDDRPTLTGWGQVFELFFNDKVKVLNHAQSGRSSKSFLREGRWEPVLREKPDFVFIQFGHNDQPGKGDRTTDPDGDFQDNLRKYIDEAVAADAQPVLVTPVARRIFADGRATTTLTPYADAMKKVAAEMNVPLVDLHAASFELFDKLGDVASADLSASASDRTHFSNKGARAVAKLVADQLPQRVPALRDYLLAAATASQTSAEPLLEKIDIFESGKDDYALYRIPGIVVTTKGTVLAYCEARRTGKSDWDTIDVMLRRSTDGGKTWSPRVKIADVPGPKTKNPVALAQKLASTDDVTYNNPVAFANRDGSVQFLFCLEYCRCFSMRSDDDGVTWTKPVEITATFDKFKPEYDWRVLATGPGHGIQLKSGRLVVPVWLSLGTGGHAHRPSVTTTIFSDDNGQTWQRGEIAVPNTDEWINPNETVIVQLADGRVMLNVRSESKTHRRLVTISPDGAAGWSKPRFDEALLEPICMGSIIRLSEKPASDKNRIVFANPHNLARADGKEADGKSRDRVNVSIKLSEDEGRTWPLSKVLEPGMSAYSDLAVLPDGTILCFYERGRRNKDEMKPTSYAYLTLARFNLEWLTGKTK